VVKKLADLAGVNCPEREWSPEELKRAEERGRRASLLDAFLDITRAALEGEEGAAARVYLEERRLSSAAPGLGFLSSVEKARAAILARGFSNDEVTASEVLHDRRWEGRLIIPIRDRWGHLASFAARALSGAVEPGDKYLYMKGTDKASLGAFGLDVALRKKADPLVLVEGLLDVVNLQALGFPNVAAIGGSGENLTPEKWERLATFGVSRVVLALDNDEAGRAGTLKALENVRKVRNGGNVPVVDVLPPERLAPYKDPDALVREKGLDAFRALLDKREPASLYLGKDLLGNVTPDSPALDRQAAAHKVATMIDRGGLDAFEVVDLLSLVEERTGYPLDALEDVVKTHEERRVQEEGRKTLAREAATAAAELKAGGDLLDVTARLGKAVDAVKVKTVVDEPPPFSVDRVLRTIRETPPKKPSGWESLDRIEAFFRPEELAVIGARPGHCKTSFLVSLLLNWLRDSKEDEALVFYSHEEPEASITARLLSILTAEAGSGWEAPLLLDYLKNPETLKGMDRAPLPSALTEAQDVLRQYEGRLHVVFRPMWSVDSIAAHARKLAERQKVGGVLVDYLQKIAPPGDEGDARRDIQVGLVARTFKNLAVELKTPVVAGAQVNRASIPNDYRKGLDKERDYYEAQKTIKKARPELYHLREGGIEPEADLVLGLLSYGADFKKDEEGKFVKGHNLPVVTRLDVETLKNRNGIPGGWTSMAYEGRFRLVRDPKYSGEKL